MNADYSKVQVALSVRQPWAWLIVNGFKDIENRTWPAAFRGPVLIHAGKKYGRAEKEDAAMVTEKFGIELPESFELGGIMGGVELVDCVERSESRWHIAGCFGFVLRNAVRLPFMPMVGRLGFFNVRGDRSFTAGSLEEVAR